jgi:methionyl-tRNA synthetase
MSETPKISYDDFAKVEIRAGKIIHAEKIADADKLLKLMVDFGEFEAPASTELAPMAGDASAASDKKVASAAADDDGPNVCPLPPLPTPKYRQIVSGIAAYFPDPAVLAGKTCMFVTNLEPRTIRGYESNGMLFAVSTLEGAFSLLEPSPIDPTKGKIPPGTRAK